MILRKPYALLIKYFKLLHVFMACFMAFLLFKSYSIYNFFRLYSIDYRSIISTFSSSDYINGYHYFFVLFVIILTVVLLVVMAYKSKPKKMYAYNLLIYGFVFILYSLCDNTFNGITNVVLDIKVSKAFRDFSLIACFFQLLSLILTVVRATGFDIKNFDFASDLQEFDISDKDNEEIEVAIDFDQDSIWRGLKKNLRNFRYTYVEYRFVINIVVMLFVLFIGIFIYLRFRSYNEYHKSNEGFSINGVSVNVQESYLVDSDINNNKITSKDGVIVAVKVQIKGLRSKSYFNNGIITLKIGDLFYGQNFDLAKELYDLGNPYINQELSLEFSTYLFTFEVSNEQAKKDILVKFNDVNSFVGGKMGAKNIYVRLKPIDLRRNREEVYNKKIGEKISFSESALGDSSLLINSFDINKSFKLNYKYCYSSNKCIDSIEYLSASSTGNYFKILMRLSGNLYIDNSISNNFTYDFRSFLNSYGTIHYKVNDVWSKKKISSEVIKPKASSIKDYFIEVPYEVKDASEIYFTFNIRNQKYKYVLK